ncbi:MAG: transporter substrate-binding domain-containing protein [Pseudomonadota bacterium]
MKKQLIVFITFLLLPINSFADETIKIGYFNNPPHITYINSAHHGALIDYWEKYLKPEMKVEIEWIGPLPPVRLFMMLEEGKINCIALLSKNEEREKKYDYPEMPFRAVNAGLAVLKKRKIRKIESLDYLKGLKIVFFKDGYIPQNIKNLNLNWEYLFSKSWKIQGLKKLIEGRTDAVFEPDRITFDYELSLEPKFKEKIMVLDIPETESFNYSIFSKKDKGKFLTLYNQSHPIILEKDKDLYKKLLADFFQR